MASRAAPKILLPKIDKIVEIGLGDLAQGDPGMGKTACLALVQLSSERKPGIAILFCFHFFLRHIILF